MPACCALRRVLAVRTICSTLRSKKRVIDCRPNLQVCPTSIAAVQRNARNIAFEPLLAQVAERIAGCLPETVDKVRPGRSGGKGGGQLVVHAMHPTLLGDGLDEMNEVMVKSLNRMINELAMDSSEPVIDLFGWCKDGITIASTDSMWGPLNPYKSKFLRDCFW